MTTNKSYVQKLIKNSENTHDNNEFDNDKNKLILLNIKKICNYDFAKHQKIKRECDNKYNEYILCKFNNNMTIFECINDNLIKKYNNLGFHMNDFYKIFYDYEIMIEEFNNAIEEMQRLEILKDNNNNKTNNYVTKVKLKYGDKYDYSKIIYITISEKIIIGCLIHGDVNQTAQSFLRNGCKKCITITSKNRSNTEEFIKKSNIVHNYKYDYSKVDYKTSSEKVIIICKIHGEFTHRPFAHLRGEECRKCSIITGAITASANNSKINTEEFIKKARIIYGDKFDYSKVNYKTSKTKIIIICRIHGEFEQSPDSYLKGNNCDHCNQIVNGQITVEEFIECAIKIHDKKYNYEDISCISYNDKITIKCPHHGSFNQIVIEHLAGKGCKQCDGLRDFIEKANIIHNNKYDYSKVKYVNKKIQVIIICKIHGEFLLTPEYHIHKQSKCLKCSENITEDTFIEKAKQLYGDKYNYSKVNYINKITKVIIICNKHGEFTQTPDRHVRLGKECLECSEYLECNGQTRHTTKTFIEKAIIVHGNIYDYSKVNYDTWYTKVIIICKIHGEFEQYAGKHLNGKKCSECNKKPKYTTELFIEKAKTVHGDKYDYSKVNCDCKDSKVIIICKEHGDFEHVALCHLRGSECPKCLNKEKFIKQAIEIHKDCYDYSKVNYVHSKINVTIICKIHGEFTQTPIGHLNSVICCPKCNLCPSCQLWKTFGKLCAYCVPKNINKLYQKTKEMDVVRFLKANLPNNEFIHNKSVGTTCGIGHLFPDILFDLQFHYLIVEIDERQHRGADYSCDKKRMYDIMAKLGLPCTFIRYNPDNKLSDKNVLLAKVNEYLNIQPDDNIWDRYGYKADYLFYK